MQTALLDRGQGPSMVVMGVDLPQYTCVCACTHTQILTPRDTHTYTHTPWGKCTAIRVPMERG